MRAPPDNSGTTETVRKSHFVFQDVARLRTQLFDTLIGPHGLTTSQASVLSILFSEDGLTQSELAARLKIGTVSLGGLVDRLEARGLVERRADPADRRANRVFLTADAYPLGRIMKRCGRTLDEIANAGLSEQAVAEMFAALERVRDNLIDALNARKAGAATDE